MRQCSDGCKMSSGHTHKYEDSIAENRNVKNRKRKKVTLHLDRISLGERMVQNSRRVDALPPVVLVVKVTHQERPGRVRVALHVHLGIAAHETTHKKRVRQKYTRSANPATTREKQFNKNY